MRGAAKEKRLGFSRGAAFRQSGRVVGGDGLEPPTLSV